ncbi:hypothetical protein [Candidatus Aquiluna sp. UB-MaderosW2red]|uniref:hypothetical protein n=1 Tax=Candidatus Aquiluna sp. UB-MaderosW2red TaxID=1855377 RepID=UPI000875EABF|nr:hypothetical protein [Candidatus Aquiluna sp. UB-MaderosW2red]SCX11132.1 Glutamine amidotransferase [Candidatus Aquiluna sp. UB-MaderosW2red]
MISLATFHPEHFNNNADQGNIEVLAMLMAKAGVGYEISTSISPDSDFVLIGDASFAAIAHYQAELENLVPILTERLESGNPTLIVGSSYEFYLKRIPDFPKYRMAQRVSGFVSVVTNLMEPVIGYRNSELFDAEVFIAGAFVGTQLYGPVLAKNPELLQMISLKMGFQPALDRSDSDLIAEIRRRTIF